MWKDTEKECFDYLVNNYEKYGVTFTPLGNSDSTHSDILVKTQNNHFYIEVKSPESQCGQFVLFPEVKTRTFVFSPQNKVVNTSNCQEIIKLMNSNFDYYSNGDEYKNLPIKQDNLYWNWVIDCYRNKDCKYFITKDYDGNFIIIPLDNIGDYFTITGVFRVKKSGSSDLPQKYERDVRNLVLSFSPGSSMIKRGKSYYVLNYNSSTYKMSLDDYSILLVKEGTNEYRVRKLSNTYNKNVIFSIKLKPTVKNIYWNTFKKELV